MLLIDPMARHALHATLLMGHDARPPRIIASFDLLDTNHLAHLSPEADRGLQERLLVSIDSRSFPNEIDLAGLVPLGLVDEFPNGVEPWDEELHGVVGEEGGDGEGQVCGVAVDAADEEHPDKGEVGAPRLEPAGVGKRLAVEALCFAGAMELDVCDGHDDVRNET